MEPDGETLAAIAGLVEDGKVRPIVDSTYPLDRVVDAYARLDSGDANGKVIVTVR